MSTPLHPLASFLALCTTHGLSVGNKNTYLKYERLGVFQTGKYSYACGGGNVRLFTSEEMLSNIERYKQWKNGTLHIK